MANLQSGVTEEYRLKLQRHATISNADVLTAAPRIYPDNVCADIGLRVTRVPPEDGQFDFVLFGPLIKDTGLNRNGISRLSATQVFGAVDECRREWKEVIVDLARSATRDGKSAFERTFQDRWDFNAEPELLASLAPRLALAGDKLFKSIFELDCDGGLQELAAKLRGLLNEPRYIAVTSTKLFLPWGMLYTHPSVDRDLDPDGSNWSKDGFWGYQYIIQHSPELFDIESGIRPATDGELPLSINFDDRLSATLRLPSIDEHIKSIAALAGKACIRRTQKAELASAFTLNRVHLERILYFYCHGHGSSSGSSLPYLKLSDGNVSASDFRTWGKGAHLPTNPLVIINACQGGQMTTLFYESFANELLKEGAVGLIGAQIDVPAVFASAYAQQLLTGFLSRDSGSVRLGPWMRNINRRMWDEFHNPLGLVYSLYRGVDCFIDWPKPN